MAKLLGSHFPVNFGGRYPGAEHHGFLAPLAHLALHLAAAIISTYLSAEAARRVDDYSESDDHHVTGGYGMSELELLDLGRLSRACCSVSNGLSERAVDPGWNLLSVPRVVLTFGLATIAGSFSAPPLRQSGLVNFADVLRYAGHLLLQPWHIELALLLSGIASPRR